MKVLKDTTLNKWKMQVKCHQPRFITEQNIKPCGSTLEVNAKDIYYKYYSGGFCSLNVFGVFCPKCGCFVEIEDNYEIPNIVIEHSKKYEQYKKRRNQK